MKPGHQSRAGEMSACPRAAIHAECFMSPLSKQAVPIIKVCNPASSCNHHEYHSFGAGPGPYYVIALGHMLPAGLGDAAVATACQHWPNTGNYRARWLIQDVIRKQVLPLMQFLSRAGAAQCNLSAWHGQTASCTCLADQPQVAPCCKCTT